MSGCVYQGRNTGRDGIKTCRINGKCHPDKKDQGVVFCGRCTDSLRIDDEDFTKRWIDPLEILNSRQERTDCLQRTTLAGRPSFLVCGGPSAKAYLHQLNRRGVFSLAVNNAAGNVVRPQAFVCSDPPVKFTHSVWQDPGVMKFVPSPKMTKGGRGKIRRKIDKHTFEDAGTTAECPNVWGFKRDPFLTPNDQFFLQDGAPWGNQDAGVTRTGQPKTVCTMLLGLRLLYYLGSRRIYLLGVDFNMQPGAIYSFNQGKHDGGCVSNNQQYSVVNEWLCEMAQNGTFKRFGLEIYNCFQTSGLRAFPFVQFSHALADVVGDVEEVPDLENWYEKQDCPKCGSWGVTQSYNSNMFECNQCGLTWDEATRPTYKGRGKRRRLVE